MVFSRVGRATLCKLSNVESKRGVRPGDVSGPCHQASGLYEKEYWLRSSEAINAGKNMTVLFSLQVSLKWAFRFVRAIL